MGKLSIPRRIGIIGGMGPLATVDLYQKIIAATPADCDQAHIPVIIDSAPQIEDRTAYIIGNGPDPCPKMIASARRLESAGAQAIVIACNTAHYFIDAVQNSVSVPIINMVSATVNAIVAANANGGALHRIAVLATDGTVRSGLYQQAIEQAQLTLVPLNSHQQQQMMACIYEGAKKGRISAFQSVFQEVVDTTSADAYIAACTEVPLFTQELRGQHCIIDATEILADEVVRFAFAEQ